MLGNFDDRLMAIGADDDHVGVLAQDAGEIGDALAAAEAGVVAQKHRTAAEMGHARLEAHPRAQRRLLEHQGHHPAGQKRLAQPLLALLLQILRDREDAFDFGGRQRRPTSIGVALCRSREGLRGGSGG